MVSGTARVIKGPGGYAQAYATVANLRLFLPLVTLPGADAANGVLKIDAVSAQATCVPGQKPTASAKMPTTVLLLGHQIPVPLSGDIPLDLGVAKVDVHLTPVVTTDDAGAAAAVEARISVDAVGLAKVSGAIILASAACTSPAATAQQPLTQTSNSAGAGTTTSQQQPIPKAKDGAAQVAGAPTTSLAAAPAADVAAQRVDGAATPLAETGAPVVVWPLAGVAVLAILTGVYLVRLKKRTQVPETPGPKP